MRQTLVIQPPYSEESYRSIVRVADGDDEAVYRSIALSVALRFYDQVDQSAPSEPFLNKLLSLVWSKVHEEGVPQPLPRSEMGNANDFDFDYIGELVEDCLNKLPRHRTEDYLRVIISQLFLTLLASEFKICRMSYAEEGPDGQCSRQSAEHCKDRISGSHCEDCPYFVALSEQQNFKLLQKVWKSADRLESVEVRGMMLPKDFRSLRVFWHLYIRHGVEGNA